MYYDFIDLAQQNMSRDNTKIMLQHLFRFHPVHELSNLRSEIKSLSNQGDRLKRQLVLQSIRLKAAGHLIGIMPSKYSLKLFEWVKRTDAFAITFLKETDMVACHPPSFEYALKTGSPNVSTELIELHSLLVKATKEKESLSNESFSNQAVLNETLLDETSRKNPYDTWRVDTIAGVLDMKADFDHAIPLSVLSLFKNSRAYEVLLLASLAFILLFTDLGPDNAFKFVVTMDISLKLSLCILNIVRSIIGSASVGKWKKYMRHIHQLKTHKNNASLNTENRMKQCRKWFKLVKRLSFDKEVEVYRSRASSFYYLLLFCFAVSRLAQVLHGGGQL